MCFLFLAERSIILVLKMQMVTLLGDPTLRIKEDQVTPTSERAHVEHGTAKRRHQAPPACVERVTI